MQAALGDVGTWVIDHIYAISNFVFAAAVAGAAVFTAKLTRELVRETVLLRKAETDPELAVYIEQQRRDHRVIDMVVRNIGSGAAYDVSFVIEPDPVVRASDPIKKETEPENPDYRLSDINLLRRGLRYLAPSQEFRFYFTTLGEAKKLNLPPISITATFSDRQRTGAGRHSETFQIDVGDFWRLHSLGGAPPEHVIADAAKKLADDVHELRKCLAQGGFCDA